MLDGKTKRKRGERNYPATDSSRPSRLPPDSINPLSRSSRLLRQFSLAGLGDTDPDPSAHNPLFPHRAVNHEPSNRILDEIEASVHDELDDQKQKETTAAAHGTSHLQRHIHVLLRSIYEFLDRRDVKRAARAYGIILQLQPDGRPVDVRRYHLWEIGAEILMREGEIPQDAEDTGTESSVAAIMMQRWGSVANMSNVRAYLETLIQQHPYDYRRPKSVCATDFWAALLRCEIYNIHAEHRIALSTYEQGLNHDDADIDPDLEDASASLEELMMTRLAAARDRIRQQTLMSMRDMSFKMRRLMQDQPYSKDPQFQELLATVSLYIADLVLPTAPASPRTIQQASEEYQRERDTAWTTFRLAQASGRWLDPVASAFLHARADV